MARRRVFLLAISRASDCSIPEAPLAMPTHKTHTHTHTHTRTHTHNTVRWLSQIQATHIHTHAHTRRQAQTQTQTQTKVDTHTNLPNNNLQVYYYTLTDLTNLQVQYPPVIGRQHLHMPLETKDHALLVHHNVYVFL